MIGKHSTDAPAFEILEGKMAQAFLPKPTEPVISRRRLLGSATALTAAGLVPIAEHFEAAPVVRSVSPGMTSEAIPNYSVRTARRLLEIKARNKLRHEFTLPALSIPNELRRMKLAEDEAEFNRFAASRRKAVWDQVLKTRRDLEGDPKWRPSWIEGLAYECEVFRILRERFRAEAK
jgi:hypothetical protein